MEAENRGYESSRVDLNMGVAMDVTTDVGFLWLRLQMVACIAAVSIFDCMMLAQGPPRWYIGFEIRRIAGPSTSMQQLFLDVPLYHWPKRHLAGGCAERQSQPGQPDYIKDSCQRFAWCDAFEGASCA